MSPSSLSKRCTNHPDRKVRAKGLCAACYVKEQREEKKKAPMMAKAGSVQTVNGADHAIRVTNPETVELIARTAVMNQLDMRAAVKKLAPELTPYEVGREAERLNKDERVQDAIEMTLEADGLDEHSKDVFVRQLWEWFLHGDKERAQTAARILGKGFIGEKVNMNKPTELRIVGFEEGVRHMLGEDEDEIETPENPDAES